MEYNGNSDFDFDDNAEFIDVDLPCNKLSIRLLANHSIVCIKKRYIFKTEVKSINPQKSKLLRSRKYLLSKLAKKFQKH